MIKTYDSQSQAFVEHPLKIYDEAAGAWAEAPSAKTYDTEAAAWVERLVRDNYFTKYNFDFTNGGGYTVSEDKKTISFDFKASGYGTVDHASLQWKGREVVNSVFVGEFTSSEASTNPDVYFYYKGTQVLASKLKTQDNNLFGIAYEGAVDEIVVNIVPLPYTACTFSLINPWFGQELKFEIE